LLFSFFKFVILKLRNLKLADVGSFYSNQYVQMLVQNGGRAKNAPDKKFYLPMKLPCLHKIYQLFLLFLNLSYMQPLV